MKQHIKEGLSHDFSAKNLKELFKEGKQRRFLIEDDLICTKGQSLFMPQHGGTHKEVIQECCDSQKAGHLRVHRTFALVEERY